MNHDDHLELTRVLSTLHATVAVAVAGGGLLVAGARIPVRGAWADGPLDVVGGALVAASCLVIVLAVVTSTCRRAVVVHGCGVAIAATSAAAVVPLVLVLGVTGWVVLGALPLALVSSAALAPLRIEPRAGRLGRPAPHV